MRGGSLSLSSQVLPGSSLAHLRQDEHPPVLACLSLARGIVGQEEELVQRISEIYGGISKLTCLKPSMEVNRLFSQLVLLCIPPNPIDCSKLAGEAQAMRGKLIRLCGEAEGLLESHFSSLLSSHGIPLDHLSLFPYYANYVAFVGSGPLPLTSIVLAKDHLTAASFHNYDIDPAANAMAARLVTHPLREYDVVFLAALVGMDQQEKERVVEHLARYMAAGATLMLRSAHGARGFLYPVVLSVFHPSDEVINSVVIARRLPVPGPCAGDPLVLPTKCSDLAPFNPLLLNHGGLMEELTLEEQAS
ncbi:unnamed protein product [Spirodela intermedia]|uniref:Nicotianamine synthase n=1 Tax=Spirodela intermedia TaxID=51605 RepID=A0A7I8JHB2_SPIIN|nr:unnamed protein product [Spirodela intermedia]CAA6669145.1 unnamed protein product [Spirodela intermedia]